MPAFAAPMAFVHIAIHIVLAYEDPFPQDAFSRVYQSAAEPFVVGEETHLDPMTARIVGVDASGRATRISFRFDVPLDDPSLRWVTWDGDGFVPYRPPPVGARRPGARRHHPSAAVR